MLQLQQLLSQFISASFTLHVKYVFQVLHFLLELLNACVIVSVHLIGLDLDHDLLSPVGELQRGDSFLGTLDQGGDGSYERSLGVPAQ